MMKFDKNDCDNFTVVPFHLTTDKHFASAVMISLSANYTCDKLLLTPFVTEAMVLTGQAVLKFNTLPAS